MSFEPPKSLQILRLACETAGVTFTFIDSFSGFVARLSKDGQSVLVGAAGIGVYPLNRAAPFAIARDKAFTHFLLKQSGFSVPPGEHFFVNPQGNYVRPPGRERDDALRYAAKLSDEFRVPLVVKPNGGKGAKLVTFARNLTEVEGALDAIAGEDDLALIQAFIDGPEFRLFLIDGEIAFAYRKARSAIEGDGQTTVRTLCAKRLGDDQGELERILRSSFFCAELETRGLSADAVLPRGTSLTLDFVSNISAAGRFDGFLEPKAPLHEWARRLAHAVSLRVTGIDVFSRSGLEDSSDIVVTDVNGSPNLGTLFELGHKRLVMDVWRTILTKTFDATWPEGF